MTQSRTMSLVEAITNVVVGYVIAVVTQMLVFPLFGLAITLAQNLQIGALFTVTSIARSFALRRMFEALRTGKRDRKQTRRQPLPDEISPFDEPTTEGKE